MAEVNYLICDRCGEKIGNEDPRVRVRENKFTSAISGSCYDDYDLCLDCTLDFEQFMKQKKGAQDVEAEL